MKSLTAEDAEENEHDKMVKHVEQMLALHKQLVAAKTPHQKEALQRQIAATDKQIYKVVEEEIKIVEGDD